MEVITREAVKAYRSELRISGDRFTLNWLERFIHKNDAVGGPNLKVGILLLLAKPCSKPHGKGLRIDQQSVPHFGLAEDREDEPPRLLTETLVTVVMADIVIALRTHILSHFFQMTLGSD